MSQQYQMRFAGSGGQGVILASVILAEAAVICGFQAVQSQAYGPEARGGVSKAETIVSREKIWFSKVLRPDFLLIDGNKFRPFGEYGRDDYLTVVHGDATYASIAAASVLAKTWRDERMRELSAKYPGYGWERNFGYPTPEHIEAIRRLGFTPEHRKSFHPAALEPTLF